MNNEKKYLFPSGGSHLLGVVLTFGLMAVSIYDLFFGSNAIMRIDNVYVDALMVFMLLFYISLLEACMMITVKDCLFAYNVDKAICVLIKGNDLKSALAIAHRLYGPIYDRNFEAQFSSTPRSTIMRKCFYAAIVLMFAISLISPVQHCINAVKTGAWSSKLLTAWVLIAIDGALIINRLFYRDSIRRFWALVLGDDNFRSILKFELSNCNRQFMPKSIVECSNEAWHHNYIPWGNRRQPTMLRLILTAIVMIVIVVTAMNIRRNKTKREFRERSASPMLHIYPKNGS